MARMTPILDAIMDDLYTAPALEGMPPSTCLGHGLAGNPKDGRYYVTMYAPVFDAYSFVAIDERDIRLAQTSERAFVELLERRIRQLRQIHWFACHYKRGGYC